MIQPYCFAYTSVITAEIPEGITVLRDHTFYHCYSLESIVLPSTLKEIEGTCFTQTTSLKNILLPYGLAKIGTYAFNNGKLDSINIPSTVTDLSDHSFGGMSSLKRVTFESPISGNAILPSIHNSAFADSGPSNSSGELLEFNVPWTAEQHKEKWSENFAWGAKNYIFNWEVK